MDVLPVAIIPVEDWVLTDTDRMADAVVRASGKKMYPVAITFDRPEDFMEYTGPDIFSPVIINGQPYIRMPSRYTDALFFESKLRDRGYDPVSVYYGENCILFEFSPVEK